MSPSLRLALKASATAGCCAALYFRVNGVVWPVLLPIAVVAALWRGQSEERLYVVAMVLNYSWTAMNHPYDLSSPRYAVLIGDVIFCGFKVLAAIHSQKWWPSWTAAFGLLIILCHLLFMAFPSASEAWAYWSAVVIFTWLGFMAFGCGVIDAWGMERPNQHPLTKGAMAALGR